MGQGLIREGAMTVNGKTMGENCRNATIEDERSSARSTNRSRKRRASSS
jgi:dihydroxyacid dehydratase/phosphogluconate dehydratase